MTTIKQIAAKALLFSLVCLGMAKVSAEEEAIALPDVTTLVSGGAITAGKDSVPDYAPLVPGMDDGRLDVPEIVEAPKEEKKTEAQEPPKSDTKFRLGGGLYTAFPLGDDLMREKVAAVFAGELPFVRFDRDKEFGGAARLLLGGVIGKEGVGGGFAGELSAELYFRLPVSRVVAFQPSFGYGLALACADGRTFFDSDLLLSCSARFIPQEILKGSLEFALTPLLHWMPFSDNAIFALGIKLGVFYSLK